MFKDKKVHCVFLPLHFSKTGVIGSKFQANFILFDSPEGVNLANLGCQPQVSKSYIRQP